MPPVQIIDDPGFGGSAQAVANILGMMGQYSRKRQDYELSQNIMRTANDPSFAGDPDARWNAIVDTVTKFKPTRAGGVTGFVQGIGDAFAPPSEMPGQLAMSELARTQREIQTEREAKSKAAQASQSLEQLQGVLQGGKSPPPVGAPTPASEDLPNQDSLPEVQQPSEFRVKTITMGPSGPTVSLERRPSFRGSSIATEGDGTGLPKGTVYRVDPETGDPVIKYKPPEQELTRKEKLEEENKLRKEFDAAQVKKDFDTVRRSESGLQQALHLSTGDAESRIASDQALGVLFQKMLDPDSVVRESEYARTPEGAAVVNQLTAIPAQLLKGGLRLEDEDRRAIVQMAERLLLESKKSMNEHIGRFEIIADENELNKTVIFGNIKPFEVVEGIDTKNQNAPVRSGFNPEDPTTYTEEQLKALIQGAN